ncbi:MAG: hypothetical protein ABI175_01055, partial [Polyangiales bacterium]
AFAFGYMLSALWNHRLLQTTIHVIQFALAADLAGFVDALLASPSPHLAAVRAELDRFARAILDEEATTLPVPGWGDQRREPADAVCAVVYGAGAAIYAEIADAAAAWIAAWHAATTPDDEAAGARASRSTTAVVRDAVAWDALQLPAATPASCTAEVAYDWPAYERAMSTRPQPIARVTSVHVTATPIPDAATEAVLLSWHMRARTTIEAAP